jgi:signal transduction histidine kinase
MSHDESCPDLISLAVHELRTPLSVVGGYLRMVLRDLSSPIPDRERRMLEEAEKSCVRLGALVGELSDLGKLDDGRTTLKREPLDLFGMVARVAEGVHEAEDRGVRLEVRGDSDGASIEGDAGRLHGAFDAIFRAILREQVGPRTVVAARGRRSIDGTSSAVVIVADEESVQTAYDAPAEPFNDKRGGLGLLLPIATRVVRAHGGRVWAPALKTTTGETLAARQGAAIIAIPIGS